MVSAALKLSLGEKNIDMVLDFLRDRSMPVYKNGLSHIVSCCGVNICPDKTYSVQTCTCWDHLRVFCKRFIRDTVICVICDIHEIQGRIQIVFLIIADRFC